MTDAWGQFKSFEGKKFEALDAEFTKEVSNLLGGKDLTACFQCAKCSAGCPVSEKVNIQVHELMRMLLFGLADVLETDMVWLCTTCYTCQERLAFKKKITPPGYIAARKSLYDSGRLYEPTDWEREDLELDDVPELNVEDTRKVLDKMGLMKLEEDE
jgi:heterodisulfide reductase subunit C